MSRPPILAETIVAGLASPAKMRDAILGDLEEEFAELQQRSGRSAARRWYWRQAIGSIPSLCRLGVRRSRWQIPCSLLIGYGTVVVLVISTELAAQQLLAGSDIAMTGPLFPAVSLLLGLLAAVVGGYAAAWVGRDTPLTCAVVLGLFSILIGLRFGDGGGGMTPLWYRIGLEVIVGPAALYGGYLRVRQLVGILSRAKDR